MRPGALVSGFVMVALLEVAPARAADPVQPAAERQARILSQRGETHFRAGLFAEALAEYQAGFELHPLPGFLINIAQCHRRMGDLEAALQAYRKYLVIAPETRFVPQVRAMIAELEALLRERRSAAAAETPDDSEGPPAPERAGLAERPTLAPQPALEARPSPIAASVPPAPQHTRWWLWGGLAVVAAGAAAATFVLLRTPEPSTIHEGTLGTLTR